MKLVDARGTLPWNTKEMGISQSDILAQLLRLLLVCITINEILDGHSVKQKIESLVLSLTNFYIVQGQDIGAVLYRRSTHQTACTWATMFSAQALSFWLRCRQFEEGGQNNSMTTMMDYYV